MFYDSMISKQKLLCSIDVSICYIKNCTKTPLFYYLYFFAVDVTLRNFFTHHPNPYVHIFVLYYNFIFPSENCNKNRTNSQLFPHLNEQST